MTPMQKAFLELEARSGPNVELGGHFFRPDQITHVDVVKSEMYQDAYFFEIRLLNTEKPIRIKGESHAAVNVMWAIAYYHWSVYKRDHPDEHRETLFNTASLRQGGTIDLREINAIGQIERPANELPFFMVSLVWGRRIKVQWGDFKGISLTREDLIQRWGDARDRMERLTNATHFAQQTIKRWPNVLNKLAESELPQ